MKIGMNLAAISYWSTEDPFLDHMKMAGDWFIDGGQYHYSNVDAANFDSNGWPTYLPDGSVYGVNVPLDPADSGATQRYVLTYAGTGNFSFVGGTIVSVGDHQVVFDGNPSILMKFSMSNSDPVHDIHIVRQDQVDLYNSGEIFNPAFLDKTDNWSELRFMDWNSTNNNTMTSWSQRTTPNSSHWGNVPIEVEVALANKTNTDMWLNIPDEANDDYVRQLATYVRDHLNSGLKLHLEYSNEVWNNSFYQATYTQTQANNLWGGGSYVWGGNEIYTGYRAAQVMAIAKDVFGASADTRLSGVLATWTGYMGMENLIFDGVNRAGLGDVSTLFKEYAVTTYFGDQLSAYGYDDARAHDQAVILGWAANGADGLTAAFNELLHGGALTSDFSLDMWKGIWAYQGQVAASHGLSMVGYEGGFSSYFYSWAFDKQPVVLDFVNRLLADPRMGTLYQVMAQDFQAAGGTELTAYNDAGPNSIWGPWGTTSTIYADSPRYDALVGLSDRNGGGTTTPPVTIAPDTTRTADPTFTMADGATYLTYIGTGTFTGTGNAIANIITGGALGNHLYGMGGDDTLVGGAGSDYLDGGTGADHMTGGAGDDIYIVDDIGDVVTEGANGGNDEVRTTLATYTLPDNVEMLTFAGSGDFHGTGNYLDNTLTGGAGNDYLDGGAGADRMVGGLGNDVYIVDNAGDAVVENPGEGYDEVRTALATYTLPDNVEKLTYTGTGSFHGIGNALDNMIVGGAGNDVLEGGAGNDILDGGAGADQMSGGTGNDIYYVENLGDQVLENPNEGIDEVRTTLSSYTLGANVENLTFVGTGAFVGIGNALDNVIRAGDGGSHISAGAGNDTLVGGAGSDWLDGGTGADTMTGGAGDDTYVVDNVGDVVVEQPGAGIDTVWTTLASYTLGDNVENLTYVGTGPGAFTGTGNALDNVIHGAATAPNKLYGGAGNDTLYGGSGSDYLDGGTGTDTMIGGAGNDVYIVRDASDVVVEQANGGTDEVRAYTNSYTLAANVEVLTFVGTGDFTGTGNAGNNVITGGAGNDHLYGGDGNDSLLGGAGNDVLDGGTGTDLMIGGMGDDTYYVDNVGDRVLESQGEGTDTIYSSVSYTLPANVERLILTGTANLNGTGNSAANTLTGNAGNNVLEGGGGADILTGGAGADRFVFRQGELVSAAQTAARITDFSHADGDTIDFSTLRSSGGGHLSFIGSSAFTPHAGQGQIRVAAVGGDWDVSLDLNGDGTPDLHLRVASATALVASDFLI